MIYAYCPGCDSINEAKIISKRLFAGKSIICQNCKERVVGQLIQKTCEECGNILYVPLDHAEMELPCKTVHEQEEEAVRIKEGEKKRENRIQFSMREIACQHCSGVILREEYGRFGRCPNCKKEPSLEYIEKKWQDVTERKPALIRWTDPSRGKLIHVDQRTDNIPPYSLLLVDPGFYVQYSSDGRDWMTLGNGRYPLFRDEHTGEEQIRLANTNDDLLLGLGTQIIFFREKKYDKTHMVSFCFSDNKWKANIHVKSKLLIHRDNIEAFMKNYWDLTDDKDLTEELELLVQNTVSRRIQQYIRTQAEDDDTVKSFGNENAVQLWFDELFNDIQMRDLTKDVEKKLCESYGITMPDPIEIVDIEVINLHMTVEVECTHCKQVNHVQADAYNRHEDFTCNSCKATMLWCNTCGRYVTNRKRFPARACDIGDHMIW